MFYTLLNILLFYFYMLRRPHTLRKNNTFGLAGGGG
jgi:hypothetical protein